MERIAVTPRQFALEVVRQLREAGFTAYWAGGCVRDELLGRTPKDYDVATNARPEDVRQLFGTRRTVNVGAAFGVVMVRGPKSAGAIEVATFRRDAAYSDGRHPDSVTFSNPVDDAHRRDFTINGLFFDPVDERVIDFVGGCDDLQDQIIRAIGKPDERIAEDKLRMLRAIRFAAFFDFQLEEVTLSAIRRHASEIVQVSAERISNELRLMLSHESRAAAAQLLVRSGLLQVLVPQGIVVYEWDESTGAGNHAWNTVLGALANFSADNPAAALALLLRGLLQCESREFNLVELAERWRLSNAEFNTMQFISEHEQTIFDATTLPWSRVQPVLIAPRAEILLLYCEALANALNEHRESVAYCREKLALPREQLDPQPLITGNILKEMGIPVGPCYRQMIDSIRAAQLDGQIVDREQAAALAQQFYDNLQDKD